MQGKLVRASGRSGEFRKSWQPFATKIRSNLLILRDFFPLEQARIVDEGLYRDKGDARRLLVIVVDQ